MKFEEFVSKVDEYFMAHQAARIKPTMPISVSNQLRYGQALMNVLHDVWYQKYLEISDSDLDCFYTNRNVAMVLDKLEKEWDE